MPEWCPPPEHVPMTTTRANVTPPLELTPGNLIPEYELIREGSQGKCKNGKNADVIVSNCGLVYTFYRLTSGRNAGKTVWRCSNCNSRKRINCKASLIVDSPVTEELVVGKLKISTVPKNGVLRD